MRRSEQEKKKCRKGEEREKGGRERGRERGRESCHHHHHHHHLVLSPASLYHPITDLHVNKSESQRTQHQKKKITKKGKKREKNLNPVSGTLYAFQMN